MQNFCIPPRNFAFTLKTFFDGNSIRCEEKLDFGATANKCKDSQGTAIVLQENTLFANKCKVSQGNAIFFNGECTCFTSEHKVREYNTFVKCLHGNENLLGEMQ